MYLLSPSFFVTVILESSFLPSITSRLTGTTWHAQCQAQSDGSYQITGVVKLAIKLKSEISNERFVNLLSHPEFRFNSILATKPGLGISFGFEVRFARTE